MSPNTSTNKVTVTETMDFYFLQKWFHLDCLNLFPPWSRKENLEREEG